MKQKPDAMIALVAIFCLGLVISGFSSLGLSTDKKSTVVKQHPIEFSASRY